MYEPMLTEHFISWLFTQFEYVLVVENSKWVPGSVTHPY